MRAFNKREKEIISILNSIDLKNVSNLSYTLQEKFFTDKRDLALIFLPKEKKVILYMNTADYSDEIKRRENICIFFELISLLRYLKENRYIDIFPSMPDSQAHILRSDWEIRNTLSCICINDDMIMRSMDCIISKDGSVRYNGVAMDDQIFDDIAGSIFGIPLISEELKQFEANGFKTRDQIRFRKTHRISIAAVCISFLIGLAGILINLVCG